MARRTPADLKEARGDTAQAAVLLSDRVTTGDVRSGLGITTITGMDDIVKAQPFLDTGYAAS